MREIGTRMALGATPSNILWLVLGHGARIAVIGAVIGLADLVCRRTGPPQSAVQHLVGRSADPDRLGDAAAPDRARRLLHPRPPRDASRSSQDVDGTMKKFRIQN